MLLSSIPLARQQRWRFLETALIWEGTVNRKRIADAFNLAMNHVSKDFSAYQDLFPQNLHYNNRIKAYLPSPEFKPAFATGNPTEYLNLQKAYAETSSVTLQPTVDVGSVDLAVIPQPMKPVKKPVLQVVLQAIRGRCALTMSYDTLSAAGARTRRVWPHAMGYDGHRWHMRALDESRKEFRDFVLGRVRECFLDPSPFPGSVEDDHLWNELVIAEIVPNPQFGVHAQRVIAADYGMDANEAGWVWTIEIRAAMFPYLAALYRLDIATDSSTDSRLILRNLEALRHLLFSTARDSDA